VSYKSLIIQYLATECARAKRALKNTNEARHRGQDEDESQLMAVPYPERSINGEISRLKEMSGDFRVPKVLGRVHPHLTKHLFLEKIKDSNWLYRTLKVCPSCCQMITYGPAGKAGYHPPESLSVMDFYHDVEGGADGSIDYIKPAGAVGEKSDGMPEITNVRKRPTKYTRDQSDFAAEAVLAKLEDPTYSLTGHGKISQGNKIQSKLLSHELNPFPDPSEAPSSMNLDRERRQSPEAYHEHFPLPPQQPKTQRASNRLPGQPRLHGGRLTPRGSGFGPIKLPSVREWKDQVHGPMSSREHAMIPNPVVESSLRQGSRTHREFVGPTPHMVSGFRPPRVPAGHGLRSNREYVEKFKVDAQIWETRPSGIMSPPGAGGESVMEEVDPEELEATRLEEQARELIVQANIAYGQSKTNVKNKSLKDKRSSRN